MPNNPPLELSPAIAAYAAKLRGLDLPPAGGRIRGPGTVRSDSVPARVAETGEAIKVSNKERIVSAEQESLLNAIAQGAGYKSLDAMFKDFGMPAGPVIKGSKRHAADGMAPEPDEPKPITSPASQNQPQEGRIQAAIAAPPTLSAGASYGRSEPVGKLSGPAAGLTETSPAKGSLSLSPRFGPGRDASGVITADSAKTAYGNDMQRSGGVFGTTDMAGVNGILERENKARGEMIDLSIKANGGNGIAILGGDGPTEAEKINAERSQRWMLDALSKSNSRSGRAAYGQAVAQIIAGNNQQTVEQLRQQGVAAGHNVQMRGQDIGNAAEMARLGLTARGQDLALQRAQERNDVIARGQDVRADVAGERIASNEAIAGARIAERAGRPEQTGRLTTAQQRSNAEIDAARTAIAGLTPEEIKRKTANFTATGRENPDFDPTLAKSVSQANRRKFGDDQEFDQRQQPQQPAGAADHGYDRKDVAQRFRSERAMDRYKLGNDTPNGVEVLDSAGKVVGHYR